MALLSPPQRPTPDMIQQNKSLEAALMHPPKPCDSERQRSNVPCFQCVPNEGWPRNPPVSHIMDSRFYSGLEDASTLFFMFYYQEGSLAQVLAAKALKSKNWRFHKKHLMWFKRIDPPKVVTAEFERGNFRYWDFFSWSEGSRDDFIFEYRYLENAELSGEFGR